MALGPVVDEEFKVVGLMLRSLSASGIKAFAVQLTLGSSFSSVIRHKLLQKFETVKFIN